MKKSEWFDLIPELKNPDIFSIGDELDLIVDRLVQIREHTVELYKLLSNIPLKRLEHHLGPVDLRYKHRSPRELWMTFPLPLPTIKVLSYCLDARARGTVMQYSAFKNFWYSLVNQVMSGGYKDGSLKSFYTFEKAIVEVKFYEVDLRTRDADNYCLVILHNSLVRNGVIADDNFDQMKYCVSGVGGCKREQTEVIIKEEL